MSDVSKFFEDLVGGVGSLASSGMRATGDLTQFLTGSRGLASNTTDKVADWWQDEVVNKKDLRGAQTETFLSGLPIIGGVIRGLEGANSLEDLYKRTGKVPAYPGTSPVGAGGLGSAVGQLARKIEDGTNDLAQFYAGEDVNTNSERAWRYMTENWNVRRTW